MMTHYQRHWHIDCDSCESRYRTSIGGTTSSRHRTHAERQLGDAASQDGWHVERVSRAQTRHTCPSCVQRQTASFPRDDSPTIDQLIEYLESSDAEHDLESCQSAEDVLGMVLSIIEQWRLATWRQEATCDTSV